MIVYDVTVLCVHKEMGCVYFIAVLKMDNRVSVFVYLIIYDSHQRFMKPAMSDHLPSRNLIM